MPDHGGNGTYDIWNAGSMLCPILSYAVKSVLIYDISKLVPSSSSVSSFQPRGQIATTLFYKYDEIHAIFVTHVVDW